MINWRSDIENVSRKNGDENTPVFLAWFPLEDLGNRWCRCVPVLIDTEGYYVFAGRACSGFSKDYNPSHWVEINGPDSTDGPIDWQSDVENAPRGDYQVFLAWFPQAGQPRCFPVWIDKDGKYNIAGRSHAGFVKLDAPTHWTEINEPDETEPSKRVGLA
jgi:hypothetical protein